MRIDSEMLGNIEQALADRVMDYFDNAYKYEGNDEEDFYRPGYGSDLILARNIIGSLRKGEIKIVDGETGEYVFPFDPPEDV